MQPRLGRCSAGSYHGQRLNPDRLVNLAVSILDYPRDGGFHGGNNTADWAGRVRNVPSKIKIRATYNP